MNKSDSDAHTFLPSLKVVRVCCLEPGLCFFERAQDFTSNSLGSAGQDLAIPLRSYHDEPWVCTNFLGCILQCSWRILQCSQHDDFVAAHFAAAELQRATCVSHGRKATLASFRRFVHRNARPWLYGLPDFISSFSSGLAGHRPGTLRLQGRQRAIREPRPCTSSTVPQPRGLLQGCGLRAVGHQNVAGWNASSTLAVSRLSPHGFIVPTLIYI